MSTEKDPMEDIFRSRFSGYEEEPSEQAWQGVQAGVSKRKNRRRALVVLFVFIVAASYSTYTAFDKGILKHEPATDMANVKPASKPVFAPHDSRPQIHNTGPAAIANNKHAGKQVVFAMPQYDITLHNINNKAPLQDVIAYVPVFEMPLYKAVPVYESALYKAKPIYSFNGDIAKSSTGKRFVLSGISLDAGLAKLSAPGLSEALERSSSLNLHFRLSERLKVSLGAGVQQISAQAFHRYDKPYSYVYDSLLVMNNKRELSYFKLYDTAVATERKQFSHTYTSVVLPLGIHYLLGSKNRIQFSAGAGLQLGKIVSGTIYNTEVPDVGSRVKNVQFDEAATFIKSYTAQMSYSLSVAYRAGAHTHVMFSPQYSYMLSKSAQVGQNRTAHLSGYGLKVSCLYSF